MTRLLTARLLLSIDHGDQSSCWLYVLQSSKDGKSVGNFGRTRLIHKSSASASVPSPTTSTLVSSSSITPVKGNLRGQKKCVSLKEYAARKAKRSSAEEDSAIASSSSSALLVADETLISPNQIATLSSPHPSPVSSSMAEMALTSAKTSTARPSENGVPSLRVLRYFEHELQ
ncbi:hypothetical protein FB446DRAFT_801529 [Lentinula raphanica]|nr:hypothetical protein FB446DRAFT_801529 [Lentinula raphanica]